MGLKSRINYLKDILCKSHSNMNILVFSQVQCTTVSWAISALFALVLAIYTMTLLTGLLKHEPFSTSWDANILIVIHILHEAKKDFHHDITAYGQLYIISRFH